MKALLIASFVALAVPGAGALAQTAPGTEQAIQVYQDVLQGRRRLEDLSPADRARLAEIDRLVRARQPARGTPAERCRAEELRRSGGNPTELERRIIDLRCSQH